MKRLNTLIILFFIFGATLTVFAGINVNLNIKRPLPPSFSDWRNDPSIIQLVMTADQPYSQIRVSFTITNMDNGIVVVKTKDNSPAMPRYNLNTGTPLVLYGNQLVREEALDFDASIRTQSVTTQMLPEGTYEFCLRLLEPNGNEIAASGVLCRQSFTVIPDPPVLIYPEQNEILIQNIQNLPVFTWSPVSNIPLGVIVKYYLKIAPVFKNQNERTAIDNNTPLFYQLLSPGRISYQYLPSDLQFNFYPDAVSWVWQVQAVDASGKPATRNDGKSEIGLFTFSMPISSINLILPENESDNVGSLPLFRWTKAGQTTFEIVVAKHKSGNDIQNEINTQSNIILKKTISDSVYKYLAIDSNLVNIQNESNFEAFIWQVSSLNNSNVQSAIHSFRASPKSEIAANTSTESSAVDCLIPLPTNKNLSQKIYSAGDTIKIGLFYLVFDSAPLKQNDLYKGSGKIAIPFLNNINIAVEFNNGISINSNNEVISGTAKALVLPGMPSISQINSISDSQINTLTDKSAEAASRLSMMNSSNTAMLPLGIDKIIASKVYIASLISLNFAANGSSAGIVFQYKFPSLSPSACLNFAGNVCISPDAFIGNSELSLVNNNILPSQNIDSWQFIFNNSSKALISNNGFNKLNLSGKVSLPLEWVEAVQGSANEKVSIDFSTVFSAQNEPIVKCSMQNIKAACLKDFDFSQLELYVDLSSNANPAGIVFPASYSGESSVNWIGLYIKNAVLTLPDCFISTTNINIEKAVSNIIIDKTGIMANLNLFGINDLNFGGFTSDLDTLQIGINASLLESGSMKGKVRLPISDDNIPFSGIISSDANGKAEYQFSLNNEQDQLINVPMWGAVIKLSSNSSISINNVNNEFKAKAILNGSLSISGKLGAVNLSFDAVSFQNIQLDEFGISGGVFSLASPQKTICGFNSSAESINLINQSNKTGISFNLSLSLYENALEGKTAFTIWAKKQNMKYVYDNIQLDSVTVDAALIPELIVLKGGLKFYSDDPVYGDGFAGNINAVILNQIQGKVSVLFGSKTKTGGSDKFRYWYVDASLISATGFPIFTGIGIYGIGGGGYYNLEMQGQPGLPASAPTYSNNIGNTVSGVTYIPKEGILGFKASITLGTHPNATPLNGDLGLEVNFVNGGLNLLKVTGNAYLLARLPDRPSPMAAATAEVSYNFANKVFHGLFTANVTYSPFLSGTGTIDILSDGKQNKWHIFMGTWQERMSLSILNLFTSDNYFMTGNDLPGGLPPFPQQVQSIFASCGKTLPQVNMSDRNQMAKGAGISMGGSSSFDGDYRFLIFYARLAAGMGYDVSLKDYPGISCAGSNSTIGINGWYAMGQMYAYVSASIGMHVDVWFTEGDFEILSGAFAAVLQGGLPNPSWVKGAVAGRYRILSGLIRGHCSFEFSIGDQCEFIVDNPLAKGLISDIQPTGNDISVFVSPAATFNFPIPSNSGDNHFDIQVMGSNGQPGPIRTFRIKLDTKTLKESNSNSVIVTEGVTDENYTLALTPNSILKAQQNYNFRIKAHGEELINGIWVVTKDKNNHEIRLDTTIGFKTGNRPNYVPDGNVCYSYPALGQRYFIADNANNKKGFIVIRQDQEDLFDESSFLEKFPEYKDNKAKYKVEYLALFKYDGNQVKEVPAVHYSNYGKPRIEFDISHLKTKKVYNLQIIGRIKPKTGAANFVGLTKFQNQIVNRKNKQFGFVSLGELSHAERAGFINSSSNEVLINRVDKFKLFKTEPGLPPVLSGSLSALGNVVNQNTLVNPSAQTPMSLNTGQSNANSSSNASNYQQFNSGANYTLISSGAGYSFSNAAGNYYIEQSGHRLFDLVDESKDVIDTTIIRKIDTKAMKTLQANEKPIFQSDIFFKTSSHASINQKLQSLAQTVVNVPCDGYWSMYLPMAGEPFDKYDVKGIKYVGTDMQEHRFGPFVKFKDDENTQWHNMVNFEVYDMLKGYTHWNGDNGIFVNWFNQFNVGEFNGGSVHYSVTHKPTGKVYECDGALYDYYSGQQNYDILYTYKQTLIDKLEYINCDQAKLPYASLDQAMGDPSITEVFKIIYNTVKTGNKDGMNAVDRLNAMEYFSEKITKLYLPAYACLLNYSYSAVHNTSNYSMDPWSVYCNDAAVRNKYFSYFGASQGTIEYILNVTDPLTKYYLSDILYPFEKFAVKSFFRVIIEGYYPSSAIDANGILKSSKTHTYKGFYQN